MSKLDRKSIQRMILKEMNFLGMADMQPMGKIGAFSKGHDSMSSCGDDGMEEDVMLPMHTSSHTPMMGGGKGSVSREDCCAAVMCLVECCSCPITKQALMECCEDIMAGDYDH